MAQCVFVVLVHVLLIGVGTTNAEQWTFRHFGDPQIGMSEPWRQAQNGNNGWEVDVQRFKKAVDLANTGRAAHIAISGDLTDIWDNQTFIDGFLSVYSKGFQQNVSLVPGNHDINNVKSADDFLTQLAHYRSTFSKDYSYEVVRNAFFLSVNSPMLMHREPNDALLAETEVQWLFIEKSLEKAQSMSEIDHIFIVMHHPPFIEDEFEEVPEGGQHPEAANMWPPAPRERFLGLVRKYGVRNLLCGHTHTTEVMRPADNAFTIYTVGGTARHWDSNGYGFRVWDVDGPFLKHRYEKFDLD